jgi:hypothetical protein
MITMKQCSKCKKEKGTNHFSKHKRCKDGLQSQCKPCLNESGRLSMEKNQNEPCGRCGEGKRRSNSAYCLACHSIMKVKYSFKVTEERAEELRAIDNCDACGRSTEEVGRALHIDHCHEGEHVRGVLCHYCNTALGLLLDDPIRILKLGMYINRATYDEQNTLSSH